MSSNPAYNLEGKTLGKWKVKTKISLEETTGGSFGIFYDVENSVGETGILKALNFYKILQQFGFGGNNMMKRLLDGYHQEKNLLELCANKRMKNVVRALDAGEYREGDNPITVPYIIFEKAIGDSRNSGLLEASDWLTKIRFFKEIVKGTRQLHRSNIYHQDIKPSNALVFPDNLGKLADLGRATMDGENYLYNDEHHQGDLRYEPIELQYKYRSTNWDEGRITADLFMLGDLFTFLLFESTYLAFLVQELPPNLRPNQANIPYESIVDTLTNYHFSIMSVFKRKLPQEISTNVVEILSYLLHPDPSKRATKANLSQTKDRFSLERTISELDLAMYKCRLIRK